MIEDEFHTLSIDDKELYDQYHKLSGSLLSDMCFNSRLAWDPGFHYSHTVVENALCLVSDGGIFTKPHLVMPMGAYDAEGLAAIMNRILPVFEANGWPMTVMYIDAQRLPLFQSLNSREIGRASCRERV